MSDDEVQEAIAQDYFGIPDAEPFDPPFIDLDDGQAKDEARRIWALCYVAEINLSGAVDTNQKQVVPLAKEIEAYLKGEETPDTRRSQFKEVK